ncbi:MAG: RNA-binding S4 domain-containing protein [Clostridiales bacterium]|nr:RNA-binding S4 domain-containing protein [Clostridiales bacterium]MCF8021577.1 RNA-binding S4 domain-containing protein [Clostridiales bacterium]
MRLDKFLKVSRLVKRRTLAKEACENKQILVNNRPGKAGLEVELNDVIEINFGNRKIKIKITAIKDTVPVKEASQLYEIIENYRVQQEEI